MRLLGEALQRFFYNAWGGPFWEHVFGSKDDQVFRWGWQTGSYGPRVPSPERIRRTIVDWCEETFPNDNLVAKSKHMREEVDEVIAELSKKRKSKKRIANELADVQIILWHLSHKLGIDIAEAAFAKYDTDLRHREWQPPDDEGIIRHVKK